MTALTVELSPEVYDRLRNEAERQGKPPEGVVQEWVTERLAPALAYDRERSIAAMRAAGLLVEPSPAMVARAARATMTLEEVSAALDRAGGKPLSEIILEQRGPKE
jgi:predicted transcriptional regulator